MNRRVEIWPSGDGELHGTEIVWLYGDDVLTVALELRFDRDGSLMPWSVSYHCAFDPTGYGCGPNPCDVIPGGRCWADSTLTWSRELWQQAVADGHDVIWDELHKWREGVWDDAVKPIAEHVR